MTITIKASTDVGAPVLTSAIGALIPILDWFLRDTLGWTKEFSNGTTGGVYRPAAGNRFYYQFNGTVAYQTEMRFFETMSAWNTGTNGNAAASMQHVNWYTNAADTTPVAYTLISDGTFVIMLTYIGDPTTGMALVTFGDIISYLPSDNYASVMTGAGNYSVAYNGHTLNTGVVATKKIMRGADQITPQKDTGFITTSTWIQPAYLGSGNVSYPNEITGGLPMFPAIIVETSPMVLRGRLPGILSPMRDSTLLPGTTFSGTGELAGRTYKVFQVGGTSYAGRIAIETSDTWRT